MCLHIIFDDVYTAAMTTVFELVWVIPCYDSGRGSHIGQQWQIFILRCLQHWHSCGTLSQGQEHLPTFDNDFCKPLAGAEQDHRLCWFHECFVLATSQLKRLPGHPLGVSFKSTCCIFQIGRYARRTVALNSLNWIVLGVDRLIVVKIGCGISCPK